SDKFCSRSMLPEPAPLHLSLPPLLKNEKPYMGVSPDTPAKPGLSWHAGKPAGEQAKLKHPLPRDQSGTCRESLFQFRRMLRNYSPFMFIQPVKHAFKTACGKPFYCFHAMQLENDHDIADNEIIGIGVGVPPGANNHCPSAGLKAWLELEPLKAVPAIQKCRELRALPAGINREPDDDGIGIKMQ
ncbi:MAG: hypothetical protein NTX06_00570, partial [Proteobacteria bacterium]|nr:hypothetical protein [Pseudomonadota bacterium]